MYSKLTQTLFLTCALALISLTAHAKTHVYDKIIVFGDSLSDDGNLFKVSGLPEKPYFEGRFSNGKLWIEMVANALHLDTTSKTQFADYAFGGAWAADAANGVGGLVPLSFERSLYFADTPAHSTDISNNLFVIWIGNNDYLQDGRLKEDADKVTNNTLKFIKAHIDALLDAGAKHFLILNVPNLGETPKARRAIEKNHPEYAASISRLAIMHNKKLALLIESEKSAHANVEFISFDLAGHLDNLIQHPEKYNIKDVTNPCYSQGIGDYETPHTPALAMSAKKINVSNMSVDLNLYPDLLASYSANLGQQQQYQYCENTNDYLFWDYVHPTTYAHELIAQFVTDLLTTGEVIKPEQS